MKTARLIAVFLLATFSTAVAGKVKLPPVFANHMILQRDVPVKVWGSSHPQEKVTVKIADKTYFAMADERGDWSVDLVKTPAGGPYVMEISDSDEKIAFRDVYFGDVWFCFGQSNMAFLFSRGEPAKEETASCNYPLIRQWKVATAYSKVPTDELTDQPWVLCSPSTVGNFSAVAFYFAKNMFERTKVPVGILLSAWGGSEIESWLPREYMQDAPDQLRRADEFKMKDGERPHHEATLLYNRMVYPLRNYAVCGFLWYQGEANIKVEQEPEKYESRLVKLIEASRETWGRGDLPFLVIQLPNFNGDPGWVTVQEAQWNATGKVRNAATVITIDQGENKDIHPKNKKEVGYRASLLARKIYYGERTLVAQGPVLSSCSVSGNTMVLLFDNASSGLVARGGNPACFELAGEDKIFYPAEARITGRNSILLHTENIPHPKYVRYAYSLIPKVNLYNKEGLPAVPFRTDKD